MKKTCLIFSVFICLSVFSERIHGQDTLVYRTGEKVIVESVSIYDNTSYAVERMVDGKLLTLKVEKSTLKEIRYRNQSKTVISETDYPNTIPQAPQTAKPPNHPKTLFERKNRIGGYASLGSIGDIHGSLGLSYDRQIVLIDSSVWIYIEATLGAIESWNGPTGTMAGLGPKFEFGDHAVTRLGIGGIFHRLPLNYDHEREYMVEFPIYLIRTYRKGFFWTPQISFLLYNSSYENQNSFIAFKLKVGSNF